MLDGLYSCESVLMVLGIAMFVLLVMAVMLYVYQRRRITALLPSVMMPGVMIGCPAFQKVSVGKRRRVGNSGKQADLPALRDETGMTQSMRYRTRRSEAGRSRRHRS